VIILSNPTEDFRAAILAAGLTAPDEIHGDGKLRRFASNGRRGDDSGWYVYFDDLVPAGAFGCWREGFSEQWCSKAPDTMTQAEREAHRQRVEAARQQREADNQVRQQYAATVAAKRWQDADQVTDHPYLTAKAVQAHGTRAQGGALLIPMRDTAGTLHSVQVIEANGSKRFHPGGRVKGCYFGIGKPDGVLIVCEGFATGATIHQATGHAVAVAFNAGNLEAVAQALHSKYPALRLILAADDDWLTDGNPGITEATATARSVGGWLATPQFPEGRGEKDSDFNDLHRLTGPEAVRACIDAAAKVDPPATNESTWPDPSPLPNALPAVAPFDMDLLPKALRGWVADIAHRMQCPPDFTAVGAVVALSSVIGARAVVKPKARDDWAVVPNLWGLIVGRPGVMKSPTLTQAMAPLTRLEAKERELWQAAHEAWELDCKVAELAAKQGEREAVKVAAKDPAKARALLQPVETPDEPKARRYIVNDSSVEKLADLLTVNQWGLMVYRDELHGLLCSMDRQGQEGARGFYLTGYDGNQGHAVDRIGRGESYVPRVCISMLGGMQPGKLQRYVRDAVSGGAGDDGLLQRFGLAVWPDVSRDWKWIDQWPDTPAKHAAWAVFERLAALQPATDTEQQEWRFTPEAQAIYREWAEGFEPEVRGDELHPALISHLSKYRKLIPALSLIFALVDTPDSGNLIHEQELIRALAWADYLRSHAERMYAAAVIPETAGAQTLLTKLKAGKVCDGDGVLLESFAPWQLAVKHWAGLNKPEDVRKAADVLADYGWLAREVATVGAKGGRPGERYLIHPKLLKGGA
jgi:putative DNA primase/helicase